MIKSLFDVGHQYVTAEVTDVLTILKTPELAADIAILHKKGLPLDFVERFEVLVLKHAETLRQRDRAAARVGTEAAQADALVAEVVKWRDELGLCFAILANRNDVAAPMLRKSLHIGEPAPTTHLAAEIWLRDVLASLAEDDGASRMPLRADFIAEGKAMHERLPKEHADVTSQSAIREKGTDTLQLENAELAQLVEELTLFNDLMFQTEGRDVPRLKLALLRSRNAPRKEEEEAKKEDEGEGGEGGGSNEPGFD
jgi:hypothetical protein